MTTQLQLSLWAPRQFRLTFSAPPTPQGVWAFVCSRFGDRDEVLIVDQRLQNPT